MAIKSSNTYGNPYHDENTGQFTSEEGKSSRGVLSKLGLSEYEIGNYEDAIKPGYIQTIVPQTNMDGTKRLFVKDIKNKFEYVKNKQMDYETKTGLKMVDGLDSNATFLNNSPQRIQMRNDIVDDIIKKQSDNRPIKNERKVTLILGLPASGKTNITNKYLNETNAFEIDGDLFTKELPEFKKNKENVSRVHKEAVNMSYDMLNKVTENGSNVVIGKVGGGNISDTIKLLNGLGEKGYSCEVVLNDLSVDKSLQRNLIRYLEGEPRLVPPQVAIIGDITIFNNFSKILQHNAVKKGTIYSNDVEKGNDARLIKQFIKGE